MSENKKGGSRNFYGEYSLEQWINFVLTKEIILPDYQRAFVWEKEDVEDLINSLKDGLFVPPVTIGNYGGKANYILDGQQRLSAILIAYIGLFPNREKFKNMYPQPMKMTILLMKKMHCQLNGNSIISLQKDRTRRVFSIK